MRERRAPGSRVTATLLAGFAALSLASAAGCASTTPAGAAAGAESYDVQARSTRATEEASPAVQALLGKTDAECSTSPRPADQICRDAHFGAVLASDGRRESELALIEVRTHCEERCEQVRAPAVAAFSRRAAEVRWSCVSTPDDADADCSALARLPHPPYVAVDDELRDCNDSCAVWRASLAQKHADEREHPRLAQSDEACEAACNQHALCGQDYRRCSEGCITRWEHWLPRATPYVAANGEVFTWEPQLPKTEPVPSPSHR